MIDKTYTVTIRMQEDIDDAQFVRWIHDSVQRTLGADQGIANVAAVEQGPDPQPRGLATIERLRDCISNLVHYNWQSEHDDFLEQGEEDRVGHIYVDLYALAEFVGELPHDAPRPQ